MDETKYTTTNLNKRILLADADQFIAVAYKDGVEQAGYEAIVASDGRKALDILKSEHMDAVILELILPKVNGFEILQFMQKNKKLKKIPVIVLTSLSQASDEAEARSYGAIDFMVKSETSVVDLIDRLNGLFSA